LASTLQLRVNDVLWEEAPRFYELPSQERRYVVRRNDESKSTVQFGDGVTGARLPTGVENITAKYRVGIGLGGIVKGGQISLLLTRPLGLKEVINPLPASGAADPETRDQARENAPFTVLTLERIVSLQDFEDFVRAYPGIGKARAVWLWDGENKVIHITIAGADGSEVPATSALYQNLRLSIQAARDPGYRVQIDSFEPLSFNLQAKLLFTRGYLVDKVKAAVTAAVCSAFSFERRGFGQAITTSELLAVMQGVEGVDAVDLDKFYFSAGAESLQTRLPARTAQWNETHSGIRPAELLLVNPREIQLTEMQP
jgi:predicted phage baseplate assembly protein